MLVPIRELDGSNQVYNAKSNIFVTSSTAHEHTYTNMPSHQMSKSYLRQAIGTMIHSLDPISSQEKIRNAGLLEGT